MKSLFNLFVSAKAFTGAVGFAVGDDLVKPVVDILVWLISLTGLTLPTNVEESLVVVLGFVVTLVLTWAVPNKTQKNGNG